MNNLHRELAPISAAAWADLEDEARRTFMRHVAGRRIVDVAGPAGFEQSAVGTGHLQAIDPGADGVIAHARRAQPIVELRVPFTVDRQQVDDVERGAKDADWQPVKDAARQIAFAEDQAIFDGYPEAGIAGIRASSSNPAISLPADVRDYPDAIGQAVTVLRMAGVNGPYTLALSADAYTAVSETSDDGYPIYEHVEPSRRRGDHLGTRDRGRLPAVDPWRRLRAAHRPGRRDRLSRPRRRQRPAVLPGDADLPRVHHRGRGDAVGITQPVTRVTAGRLQGRGGGPPRPLRPRRVMTGTLTGATM